MKYIFEVPQPQLDNSLGSAIALQKAAEERHSVYAEKTERTGSLLPNAR